MKTLIYSSISPTAPDAATVLSILAIARHANPVHGIRGVLLVADRMYMQVLEGPVEAVDRLLGNIQRDPRHACVVPWLIEERPDRTPMFEDWSMAFARVGVSARPEEGLDAIEGSRLHAILAAHPVRPASRVLRGFLAANERAVREAAGR